MARLRVSRVSPRRHRKFHGQVKFSRGFAVGHGATLLWGRVRGFLWVTERGLLSLKAIVGVQEWVL